MANRMTQTEYQGIKNSAYTVISFREGRRVLTYYGLNLRQAMEELLAKQAIGCNCVVMNSLQADDLGIKLPHSRNEDDFAFIKEIKWDIN